MKCVRKTNYAILRVYGFCEFCSFQDLAEGEIRYRSRALPRQRDAGEEVVVEARAAVRLERVSAHQTMPTMPHERSGASLGKFKIRDLEISVIFGIRDFQKFNSLSFPCSSSTTSCR